MVRNDDLRLGYLLTTTVVPSWRTKRYRLTSVGRYRLCLFLFFGGGRREGGREGGQRGSRRRDRERERRGRSGCPSLRCALCSLDFFFSFFAVSIATWIIARTVPAPVAFAQHILSVCRCVSVSIVVGFVFFVYSFDVVSALCRA